MTLSGGNLYKDRSGDQASRVYHLVNKVLLPYVGFLLRFDEMYVCV